MPEIQVPNFRRAARARQMIAEAGVRDPTACRHTTERTTDSTQGGEGGGKTRRERGGKTQGEGRGKTQGGGGEGEREDAGGRGGAREGQPRGPRTVPSGPGRKQACGRKHAGGEKLTGGGGAGTTKGAKVRGWVGTLSKEGGEVA